ncbi:transposable element Tcb1 transposase [Trichonephila clavipes]|nr:transposable element Tcb1 transposase [Trichonephila clavipes]
MQVSSGTKNNSSPNEPSCTRESDCKLNLDSSENITQDHCCGVHNACSLLQEGTTDRRGRTHPPQCTTSPEDRQIVCMAVTDRSVTSQTIAHHIESVTHHSVSARTIRHRPLESGLSARRRLFGSTLGVEPRTSPSPMPALHLRGVGVSCPSLPSGLGHSHISTG